MSTKPTKPITIKEVLDIKQADRMLEILHQENAIDAIYDICDMDGRIRLSGTLNSNGKTEVDISNLRKGQYQLFVINQGLVTKKLIALND